MLKKIVVISLLTFAISLSACQQDEVPLLRWEDPTGAKPGTFKEWIAEHPYTPETSVKLNKTLIGNQKAAKVAIIIQSTIASYISTGVTQLMTNLQTEGYTVSNYSFSGGTPESLKAFIKNLYNSESIEGALLIGNLPIPWFQVGNDYNTYGYAEWPIDLFYMDLNGTWLDTLKDSSNILVPGKDTVYDTHSGNIAPEIYIGRLTPTGIGTDTASIRNYLTKDNGYRHHTSVELPHKALVYVDDDWYYWAPQYANNVALLYNDTSFFRDSNVTRALHYKARLDSARAWVSNFVHSGPTGHSFYYNNHTSIDYYYSSEYRTQNPPANFYNHFACSFARYTTSGYGGGSSIFNQTYGIGAIGSTKTGSMLDFEYFYQPLSEGKNLGAAFKDWFTYITSGGVSFDELCWHYGMTLLGDPFLKPKGHIAVEESANPQSLTPNLQISPNPFYQSAIISYQLPFNSKVALKLYDASGRCVRNLINGEKQAGSYTVELKQQNLLPGIYFAIFSVGNFKTTQKLILMK